MTNWKVFKITGKQTFPCDEAFRGIKFNLDGDVTYKGLGNTKKEVKVNNVCFMIPNYKADSYDYESYQIGDYLEVNLDETVNYSVSYGFNEEWVTGLSDNIVRKFGSSAVVSSSSGQMSLSREQAEAFADRLADRVERSGGQYELDAYIQQGTEPHGTPYTRQGWVYRKK